MNLFKIKEVFFRLGHLVEDLEDLIKFPDYINERIELLIQDNKASTSSFIRIHEDLSRLEKRIIQLEKADSSDEFIAEEEPQIETEVIPKKKKVAKYSSDE